MKFEFDPEKSRDNEKRRGLSFDMVQRLDWSVAAFAEDARKTYGEKRINALAPLDGRLCFVCFTQRGDVVRIISFRKANSREVREWQKITGQ